MAVQVKDLSQTATKTVMDTAKSRTKRLSS